MRDRPAHCAACHGGFKLRRTAALRSLLFPGLGDWYLGHRGLAAMEIGFTTLLWIGLLLPDPEHPQTFFGFAAGAMVVLLFIHVPDSLLTRYIAGKGLYPAEPPREA